MPCEELVVHLDEGLLMHLDEGGGECACRTLLVDLERKSDVNEGDGECACRALLVDLERKSDPLETGDLRSASNCFVF